MTDNYIIPLSDLKTGVYTCVWDASDKFFEEFENEQIRSAELEIRVQARKTGVSVEIDLDIKGTLTVPCDRCLEDVEMPVDTSHLLKVRFGQQPEVEVDEEDGRELVWLPQGEPQVDLSQAIYDFSCLSLPIQCRHREGECNPEALRHLNPSEEVSQDVQQADSPFAALKGMFGK